MTLIERLEAPQEHGTISQRLDEALMRVPGAVGLAITHLGSITKGIFVIDAQTTDEFLDAEERAIESLLGVRRAFPESAIDLLCVSTADAGAFNVPPEAAVYSYR